MEKQLSKEETNEIIIGLVNEKLEAFCIGEHKDDNEFPIISSHASSKSKACNAQLRLSLRLRKNDLEITSRIDIKQQEKTKKA